MCQIQTIVFNFLCKICQSISSLHVHLTDISLHTKKIRYFALLFTFKLLLLWLLYDLKKFKKKKSFSAMKRILQKIVYKYFSVV